MDKTRRFGETFQISYPGKWQLETDCACLGLSPLNGNGFTEVEINIKAEDGFKAKIKLLNEKGETIDTANLEYKHIARMPKNQNPNWSSFS